MTSTTQSNRKPTFIAYTITERTGARNIWTAIGAAWPHRNGRGFNIQLRAFPIDGKIVLTEPRVDEPTDEDMDSANRGGEDIPF